jgi:hypothetical protein
MTTLRPVRYVALAAALTGAMAGEGMRSYAADELPQHVVVKDESIDKGCRRPRWSV